MSDVTELINVIAALRSALDRIESDLVDSAFSGPALEDFKSTIDNVRTSVLAIITADAPSECHNFLRKFRLRRGAQICQNVLAGLVDGSITADTPAFEMLHTTVDETLARVDRLMLHARLDLALNQ